MRDRSISSALQHSVLLLACFSGLALQAQSTPQNSAAASSAPPDAAQSASVDTKIQQQIAAIHLREQEGASVHELGYRWALIGSEYGNASNFTQAEAGYNHALKMLAPEKNEATLYADVLDQLGALYRIYDRMEEAARCYRAALAAREPLQDPLETARSHARLAELSLSEHHYKEAYEETDQAYQSLIRMHDPDDSEVISALIVRAYAACGMHKYRKGEEDAVEALSRSRKFFPEGSMQLGASFVVLGLTQLKNGETASSEESLHQAVDLFRTHLVGSDPRLIFVMTQYRESLLALHRKEEAQRIHSELEAMAVQQPPACSNCTISAFALRSPAYPQKLSAGDPTMRATGGAVAWMLGAPGFPAQ